MKWHLRLRPLHYPVIRFHRALPPGPLSVGDGTLPEAVGMKEIYLVEIRPYLAPDKEPDARQASPGVTAALFRHLKTVVPPALHPTLKELEAICDERAQLSQQK